MAELAELDDLASKLSPPATSPLPFPLAVCTAGFGIRLVGWKNSCASMRWLAVWYMTVVPDEASKVVSGIGHEPRWISSAMLGPRSVHQVGYIIGSC